MVFLLAKAFQKAHENFKKPLSFLKTGGKKRLKSDYHEKVWYGDFLEFLKENQIFATLLTPSRYAQKNPDARWDTRRICDFNEILGEDHILKVSIMAMPFTFRSRSLSPLLDYHLHLHLCLITVCTVCRRYLRFDDEQPLRFDWPVFNQKIKSLIRPFDCKKPQIIVTDPNLLS